MPLMAFLLLAFCISVAPALAAPRETPPAFRVVGYLPGYRAQGVSPGAVRGVSDLVFFSVAPTPAGGIDAAALTPAVATQLQALRGPARLWVAVGGWNLSAGFGPVATDPARRRLFVAALTQFCLGHKFAGADFDWESPATPAEQAGFTALLVETRAAFAPHGLGLSVAVAAWQPLARAAIAAVDAVNLMAYDHDGRHATLQGAKDDTERLIAGGVPAAKICLGIPFYGRGITDRTLEQAYADIVGQARPAPDVDEAGGVYFNGPETVRRKTQYALARHLGGVMVWELGQDTSDQTSLLAAIRQAVAGTRGTAPNAGKPLTRHTRQRVVQWLRRGR